MADVAVAPEKAVTQDLIDALQAAVDLQILPMFSPSEDIGDVVTLTITLDGLNDNYLAIIKAVCSGVDNPVWVYKWSRTIPPPPVPPNLDGTPGIPGTTYKVVITTVIKTPTPNDVKKYIGTSIFNITTLLGGAILNSSPVTDKYSYTWNFITQTAITSPDVKFVTAAFTTLVKNIVGDVQSKYQPFRWGFTGTVAQVTLPDYPDTLNLQFTFNRT